MATPRSPFAVSAFDSWFKDANSLFGTAAGADGGVPAEGQTVEPMKTIVGKVVIEVTENGLNVQAPPNLLLALAVLNAGKAFLEMQYTDALKAAMKQAPKIVRPSDSSIGNMMKNLNGRPS